MTDHNRYPTTSYRLLGILMSYAPDGPAQEECVRLYHALQADYSDRLEVDLRLVRALHDGLEHGNWFWNHALSRSGGDTDKTESGGERA